VNAIERDEMTELTKGMLVRHELLGLGKVVALEPKTVHVFFAASKDRFATKLSLLVAGPLLRPAGAGENAWLEGMSAFSRDAKTGRFGLAQTWLTHEEAVARFLETFPQGFTDPAYTGGVKSRREHPSRWRRAHEAFGDAFGGGEGERLLAAGEVGELVARAVRVEHQMRSLHKDALGTSYAVSLGDPDAARGFFAALFDVLAAPAPERARFEVLAAAVAALPGDGSVELGWPLVTELPFAAQPERHALLRPKFTCDAAHRLGLELCYHPAPNWSTYAAVLRSAGTLLEKLWPLGARDHIDVDAFMHVATAKRPARSKVTARPAM
jgi:hypothetical protein